MEHIPEVPEFPLKPSPRHEHVYAIVRYESTLETSAPIEFRVTVKKIVRDPKYAEAEVRRLNELNRDKGCVYFAQITRLENVPVKNAAEPGPAGSASESSREVQPDLHSAPSIS